MSELTMSRLGTVLFRSLGLALLAFFVHGAALATNCTQALSSLTYMLPGGTYTVPRDSAQPVGTVLTPWTSYTNAPYPLWSCFNIPADMWSGPEYRKFGGLEPTGVDIDPPSGGTYRINVFKTTLPGVGLAVAIHSAIYGGWQKDDSFDPSGNWIQGVSLKWNGGYQGDFGISFKFAFVKIGPIQSGYATATTNPIGEAAMRIDGAPPHMNPVTIHVSGGANFVVAGCTTPNVVVDLGTHMASEFGATTGPTPTSTAFKIQMKSCPAGLAGIKYRIDPTTSVLLAAQSVVALNGSSTASGVGVQLLNDSGNVLALSVDHPFYGYYGAGDYSIPLRARYYKTNSMMTGGTANTSMTFTMTYL